MNRFETPESICNYEFEKKNSSQQYNCQFPKEYQLITVYF